MERVTVQIVHEPANKESNYWFKTFITENEHYYDNWVKQRFDSVCLFLPFEPAEFNGYNMLDDLELGDFDNEANDYKATDTIRKIYNEIERNKYKRIPDIQKIDNTYIYIHFI